MLIPLSGGLRTLRRRSQIQIIAVTICIVYALYSLGFRHYAKITHKSVWEDGTAPQGHADASYKQPSSEIPSATDDLPQSQLGTTQKAIVVGRMERDNINWLFENFPDWEQNIYVVDNPNAELAVPQNKGRESLVYLTYIIDHYDHLPDIMLFLHPTRYQWHNDDPYYDGVPMVHNLQVSYLKQQGYVNLRCVWSLGCPAEIHPLSDTHRENVHAGAYYKNAFMELFPGQRVPSKVGVSCCAQFGVTREKVRERPRSEYERYRTWLLETPLTDDLSGRIMEYSWHMIFGQEPVHCPSAEECYCNVFGLCGLECPGEGSCDGRYVVPPYSNLPDGWPYIGWNGQAQDPTTGLPAS